MILTGAEIASQQRLGHIEIAPFDAACLEPNSYGFHLGDELLVYDEPVLDATRPAPHRRVQMDDRGYELKPGRFYLGHTAEILGSSQFAMTLLANRSVSTLGMWIHISAPLGHRGSNIAWTLELVVVHPLVVVPGMRVGKIAFWENDGDALGYVGKYAGSDGPVASRLFLDDERARGGTDDS